MTGGDAYRRYEAAFEGIDAPFAFVDLDALRSNSTEMVAPRAGQADPPSLEVGPLPSPARADSRE